MNVAIIIPTYNENGNIFPLYNKLKKIKKNYDILFVDDNSNDGTIDEIKSLRKIDKKVFFKIRNTKDGIGSAHKFALNYCNKKSYDIAITLDADGTHNPAIIPRMIKLIDKYDLIITNRFKYKSALKNWHWLRKFLTLIRFYLVNILLNIHYDTSGGFRCYNLKKIKISDILLSKNNSYSFFWESTYILSRNYKIKELPIVLPYRKIGVSKMKFTDVFAALVYLIFFSFKRFFL